MQIFFTVVDDSFFIFYIKLDVSNNLSGGVFDGLAALRNGLRGLVLDRRRHEAQQLLPPDQLGRLRHPRRHRRPPQLALKEIFFLSAMPPN